MIKTYISALLVALLGVAQLASAEIESTGQAPSSADSEMVSWLLDRGVALYDENKYDEAITMFDGVLAIDKYNAKAVSYRKRASKKILSKESRNQGATRAQAIADINAAWNPEPKVYGAVATPEDTAVSTSEQQAIAQMEARMKAITIPSLDFTDANVVDVLLFLSAANRRYSSEGGDVDVALLGMDRVANEGVVSISFADLNLYEALQFVAEMTSLKVEIGPNVVSIMPANYVPLSQMVTRAYDINPEVGIDLESVADADSGTDDLFGDSFAGESSTGPIDVAGFFSVVSFPEGASAVYQPRFYKLFAKNTQKNLAVLEVVLAGLEEEAIRRRTQQVEIETKFVEFNEGSFEELGFDWTVYGNGSVAGFTMDGNYDYYFQKGSGYDTAAGIAPAGPPNLTADPEVYDPVGPFNDTLYVVNPETGLAASGQQLIDGGDRKAQNFFGSSQRDNTSAFVDPILTGVLSTMGGVAPAMMFTDGNVDVRITAMEQEGTADVLSAPRVTTKSGNEALIRIAETHRYPQDYLPETGQRTAPIVKPQDWQDFDMGVSLKVTPVVDPESGTIDLSLHPQILAYRGVDAYLVALNVYDKGTDKVPLDGGDGALLHALMPYFERRSVQTSVSVADGGTVVLGGLINERSETFRDQVPILGDIPYLGRLFRSEGSRMAKKNLTIFVKASLIDPQGMTSAEREQARQTAAN